MSTASPPQETSASKLRLPASCNPPSDSNPAKQKVWIVFGATGHIGRSLVRTALSHGDKVTAVGSALENTYEQMQGWHERCLGLLCDVRLQDTVDVVVQRTIKHWGRIDIIANCTGYGVIAAAEDQSEHDVINQFTTNFMGTLHIIQSSLTYFRTSSIPGRYLIFSSTAGALGVPGMAPYCATKYAVEGLIESMLYETHAFSIRATLVEPGHVRMDDPASLLLGTHPPPQLSAPSTTHQQQQHHQQQPHSHFRSQPYNSTPPPAPPPSLKKYGHFSVLAHTSAPYRSPHAPAQHTTRIFQWFDTHQPTSVVRATELVWQLGHCAYPPLRLLLGSYAVESVRDRLKSITEEIEDWKHLHFQGGGGGEREGDAEGFGDGGEGGDIGEGGEGGDEWEGEEGDSGMVDVE